STDRNFGLAADRRPRDQRTNRTQAEAARRAARHRKADPGEEGGDRRAQRRLRREGKTSRREGPALSGRRQEGDGQADAYEPHQKRQGAAGAAARNRADAADQRRSRRRADQGHAGDRRRQSPGSVEGSGDGGDAGRVEKKAERAA